MRSYAMRISFIPVILGLVIIAWLLNTKSEVEKINGVSLVSPPREVSHEKVAEVKRVNAGWVAVIPYGFSRAEEPSVSYDSQRQWWGERTQGSCELIKFAKMHGFKVLLKPHIWVLGQGWCGDYDLASEADWEIWQRDYTKYILNHAKVADSMNVEMFCIGTEYRIPARKRPAFWRGLIQQVRDVYDGEITYASNWDNYMNITWWDEVDYIGIDSYFPLTEGNDPALEDIKEGWEPLRKELKELSDEWNKPILFTEYGFQSVNGATGKHWEVDKSYENANMEIQRKAYEATFQSLWEEPWFAGGFLWKWHLTTRGAQSNKTRFTPQGKPAEKVIAKWYGKTD